MRLLGVERKVTQDYAQHGTAEDYAGTHMSNIQIYGRAKVVSVVNKYRGYYDTIDYDDFKANKNAWKDGVYYNCISISGKTSRIHQSETGGNQVKLEFYSEGSKYYLLIKHMSEVFVNVGDIVTEKTIIGTQGNTGLVSSLKSRNDITYGSHIHCQVLDSNLKPINPRIYTDYTRKLEYLEQTNEIDDNMYQIKILADKINIREQPNKESKDLGDVYTNEIYTVLTEKEDDTYKWYKIKTNLGIVGYVASEKGKNWIEEYPKEVSILGNHTIVDETKTKVVIFECGKEGLYAIKLKKGEKLYVENGT